MVSSIEPVGAKACFCRGFFESCACAPTMLTSKRQSAPRSQRRLIVLWLSPTQPTPSNRSRSSDKPTSGCTLVCRLTAISVHPTDCTSMRKRQRALQVDVTRNVVLCVGDILMSKSVGDISRQAVCVVRCRLSKARLRLG